MAHAGRGALLFTAVRPPRIPPGPGQESVWDYPRPPRVEPCRRRITVVFNGAVVAATTRALRVLETSQPPAYYVPPEDVRRQPYFAATRHVTECEWKGRARYWEITVAGRTTTDAAWSYPDPAPGYEALRDHLAFYPSRVDACWLDGERVRAQDGDFYGGWITHDVVGPFKGAPGTLDW